VLKISEMEKLQMEIEKTKQKIKHCKVNDMLYDLESYEAKLEILEEELKNYVQ
jgi:hypothetical protein